MSNEQWVAIADVGSLVENDAIGITVEGQEIALFNVAGSYHATSNLCTHGNARLCDGYMEDDRIECPLHQGLFHIPTGKALGAPATEALKTYPIRIEGKRICVRLD